jgi:transcriptional regulator with XRE-family HTH domain
LTNQFATRHHVGMTASDEQHSFIENVLSKTGWSQTDLANRAGLDPSTLSRFLTKGRDGHALRPSTIQRISSVSGVAFGNAAPLQSMTEKEAEPYVFSRDDGRSAAVNALAKTRSNVDAWTLNSRALENAGYRPGDVLLVGLNETPLAGDVVCAQIFDWTKDQAETIFRIFQPPALIGASNDASLLKPYLLGDSSVVIKGVVLHTLRSRP